MAADEIDCSDTDRYRGRGTLNQLNPWPGAASQPSERTGLIDMLSRVRQSAVVMFLLLQPHKHGKS
jgi:hypothetical protein